MKQTNGSEKCPICGVPSVSVTVNRTNDNREVKCSRCGSFEVRDIAWSLLDGFTIRMKEELLRKAKRDQNGRIRPFICDMTMKSVR